MEINKLETGRKLDYLIAKKVMGYETFLSKKAYFKAGMPHAMEYDANIEHPAYFNVKHQTANIVPYYSTDIAAFWQVVEKLVADGYEIGISSIISGSFEFSIYRNDGEIDASILGWEKVADTAMHAGCLAALEAVK